MNTRSHDTSAGFSVVEVVIAAAIMFFVLTALFGLISVSQSMASSAQERSALTNGVGYYADTWRLVPYDALGVTKVVPASDSLPVGSADGTRTIYFVNSLASVGGVKQLTIRATMAGRNGKTYAMSVVVDFSDPSTSGGGSTNATAPVVSFASGSPAGGSVLYGNHFVGATPTQTTSSLLTLIGHAYSPTDDQSIGISRIKFLYGGNTITDGMNLADTDSYPNGTALPQHATIPDYQYGLWNTASGSYGAGDGIQTVQLYALDNSPENLSTVLSTQFIVDNVPPSTNPAISISAAPTATAYAIPLQWTAPTDGTGPGGSTYAARYRYWVWADKPGAGSGSAPSASWDVTSGTSAGYPNGGFQTVYPAGANATWMQDVQWGSNVPLSLAVNPLSRYYVEVQAGGPIYMDSDNGNISPFISRPLASGTYGLVLGGVGNAYSEYTITLDAPPPTFDSSFTSYTVEAYDWSTKNWKPFTSVTSLVTVSTNAPGYAPASVTTSTVGGMWHAVAKGAILANPSKAMYYRMAVKVTPKGWNGGTAQTVYSNALGPSPATSTFPSSASLGTTSNWQW